MNHLDSVDISQLLELIKPDSSVKIMHLGNGDFDFNKRLVRICRDYGYEFDIKCLGEADYTESLEHFEMEEGITVARLRLTQPRYATSKLYDYVFVTVEIPANMMSLFLAKTYESLKNGGLVLITEDGPEESLRRKWGRLLDSNYFISIKTIPLASGHSVIIAKKAQAWG